MISASVSDSVSVDHVGLISNSIESINSLPVYTTVLVTNSVESTNSVNTIPVDAAVLITNSVDSIPVDTAVQITNSVDTSVQITNSVETISVELLTEVSIISSEVTLISVPNIEMKTMTLLGHNARENWKHVDKKNI